MPSVRERTQRKGIERTALQRAAGPTGINAGPGGASGVDGLVAEASRARRTKALMRPAGGAVQRPPQRTDHDDPSAFWIDVPACQAGHCRHRSDASVVCSTLFLFFLGGGRLTEAVACLSSPPQGEPAV